MHIYGCTHLDLVATAVQHVCLNIYAASVEGQIDAIRQSQQQLDQVQAPLRKPKSALILPVLLAANV